MCPEYGHFHTYIYLPKYTSSYSPPPMAQQPLVSQGLLIIEALTSHSDTPHSTGLLWRSDQPDAENSTRQNTTLTREEIHDPGGIRTSNPSKRAAADPRLRPCGHRSRPPSCVPLLWAQISQTVCHVTQSRHLGTRLATWAFKIQDLLWVVTSFLFNYPSKRHWLLSNRHSVTSQKN